MKKQEITFLGLLVALFLAACNNNSGGNQSATNNADSLNTYDSATMVNQATDTASNSNIAFAVKAGALGTKEVQLSQYAQQNAVNPRVKNFAAMMVREHSQSNKELAAIAANKNIAVPAMMNREDQLHFDQMKNLRGSEFDSHYMDMMVSDHKRTINEFENAANTEKDADLKNFASKMLPHLRMHLDSAQAIQKDLK